MKQLGNFLMSVPFKVVEEENQTVSLGQFGDGPGQSNAVNAARKSMVNSSVRASYGHRFLTAGIIEVELLYGLLAKMHKHGVQGDTIQPAGECTISPKSRKPSEYPHKSLLREVFRFRRIIDHAQTYGKTFGRCV